ncbi:MAG: NAD(P)/FAD-dependent oxidoreductase [Actinobacteria bacterium]|nr:NAD(P)/FAD-dependent oxidoreductase [Actinomycetota bacterium]
MSEYDAVVVGAGPNGLAAAAELTRAGERVLVVERAPQIGGGTRTAELTLPGFLHDVCSAIHPLGLASPFFREIGVGDWIHPEIPVTHPLDGGRVVALHRSITETAEGLGTDAPQYRRLVERLVADADELVSEVLAPMRMPPRHPVTLARFGLGGLMSASRAARRLETEEGRALYAGLVAHAIAPFGSPMTHAVAKLLAVAAHAYGWPLARGGSQRLAEALAEKVTDGGGSIETGHDIRSLDDLPGARSVLLDVMPDAALRIAGSRIGRQARRRMERWKSGPGVFKVDWALDAPIPWTDPASGRAGTVHVGGTYEEVAAAESLTHSGEHPERPFVIVAQQSLFDPTRAPAGKQVAWSYCHVPAGSGHDMTDVIEAQIERFAPGFRDLILDRHVMGPAALAEHNPNYVGGDIGGGAFSVGRFLRVGGSRNYRLGEGLYICSSAAPPGAGVHGMAGYHAARAAIAARR